MAATETHDCLHGEFTCIPEECNCPDCGSRDDEVVWALTRGHLEEMAGRPLADDEVARVAKCFEYSTIGDVISGVLDSCGLWPPDEDDA